MNSRLGKGEQNGRDIVCVCVCVHPVQTAALTNQLIGPQVQNHQGTVNMHKLLQTPGPSGGDTTRLQVDRWHNKGDT